MEEMRGLFFADYFCRWQSHARRDIRGGGGSGRDGIAEMHAVPAISARWAAIRRQNRRACGRAAAENLGVLCASAAEKQGKSFLPAVPVLYSPL